MSLFHLARVGTMGRVGRFSSADGTNFLRGSDVIVRTPRGLEIATILAPPDDQDDRDDADGAILRGMTAQDHLLAARLDTNRDRAFAACRQRLAELDCDATLIDVEHLFDGRSLFFYFLGEITPVVENVTRELADTYEANVKFREFTDALINGCGPDCGTDDAAGGCASCISCAVSSACGSPRV